MCQIVLYVLMKQAETFLYNVEVYDFCTYLASGTSFFIVQQ